MTQDFIITAVALAITAAISAFLVACTGFFFGLGFHYSLGFV